MFFISFTRYNSQSRVSFLILEVRHTLLFLLIITDEVVQCVQSITKDF